MTSGGISVNPTVRRHILGNLRHPPDKRKCSDTAELVYGHMSGQKDVVRQFHMAGQDGRIGEDVVVADDAVVAHVGEGE